MYFFDPHRFSSLSPFCGFYPLYSYRLAFCPSLKGGAALLTLKAPCRPHLSNTRGAIKQSFCTPVHTRYAYMNIMLYTRGTTQKICATHKTAYTQWARLINHGRPLPCRCVKRSEGAPLIVSHTPNSPADGTCGGGDVGIVRGRHIPGPRECGEWW
jgi:hypothetical protein